MKPNPQFDELTLRWWKITGSSVKRLAFATWAYSGYRGRWGDYSRTCRRELKQLCRARREVFRAGTAI